MPDHQKAHSFNLVAKVVARPEFVGTLHDNDMARSLGYPAALVPGIDIYAYLTSFALKTWGSSWLSHGALASTSIRPVYDGDPLTVYVDAPQSEGSKRTTNIAIHNAEGIMVASAQAAHSEGANSPPGAERFPIQSRGRTVPSGEPSALQINQHFTSITEEISRERNRELCREFLEPSSFYTDAGIVHPAYLQRLALRNAHTSFTHATPPIFISTDTQNFGALHVGETVDTPGFITKLWERKGHHYMESEQLVIANGERPVALIRRVTIYQARRADADSPQPQ